MRRRSPSAAARSAGRSAGAGAGAHEGPVSDGQAADAQLVAERELSVCITGTVWVRSRTLLPRRPRSIQQQQQIQMQREEQLQRRRVAHVQGAP